MAQFEEFAKLEGVNPSKFVDFALGLQGKTDNYYVFGHSNWTGACCDIYYAPEQEFVEQQIENSKKEGWNSAKIFPPHITTLLSNLYDGLTHANVSDEDLNRLLAALVELGDEDSLEHSISLISKATKKNVQNIQAAIIARGDGEQMVKFAAKTNGADYKLIASTLVDKKDARNIYSLALLLKRNFAIFTDCCYR